MSSVPLQQAIRPQQAAYAAFFTKRRPVPAVQVPERTAVRGVHRSGFRWHDGRLHLAKMGTPLAFT